MRSSYYIYNRSLNDLNLDMQLVQNFVMFFFDSNLSFKLGDLLCYMLAFKSVNLLLDLTLLFAKVSNTLFLAIEISSKRLGLARLPTVLPLDIYDWSFAVLRRRRH